MPERPTSATTRLLAGPDAPSRARHLVVDLGHGLPSDLLDDAALAISEVVTNVVRHVGGILTISIECGPDAIAVAVADGSPIRPVALTATRPLTDHGRGLRLVAALADAWGCRDATDGDGKVVWFRMSAHVTDGRAP